MIDDLGPQLAPAHEREAPQHRDGLDDDAASPPDSHDGAGAPRHRPASRDPLAPPPSRREGEDEARRTYRRDYWIRHEEQETAEELARSQGTTLQRCPRASRPLLFDAGSLTYRSCRWPCGRPSCDACRLRSVARWRVKVMSCFPLGDGAYVTQVPDAKAMNRVGEYLRSHGAGYFSVAASNGGRFVLSTVPAAPPGRAPESRWLPPPPDDALRREVTAALLDAPQPGRPRWSKTLQPKRPRSDWVRIVRDVRARRDLLVDDIAKIQDRVNAVCQIRFGAPVIWPDPSDVAGTSTRTAPLVVEELPPGMSNRQVAELLRVAVREHFDDPWTLGDYWPLELDEDGDGDGFWE